MVSHGAQSTMFGSLTPQCIGVGITEEMCRLENVKKRLQKDFKKTYSDCRLRSKHHRITTTKKDFRLHERTCI